MEEILLRMRGRQIPSLTGVASYEIAEIVPGQHVTLTGANRSQPSLLRWADIRRVLDSTRRPLDTKAVDEILENPQNRNSSTMCALVLAMRDPSRVR